MIPSTVLTLEYGLSQQVIFSFVTGVMCFVSKYFFVFVDFVVVDAEFKKLHHLLFLVGCHVCVIKKLERTAGLEPATSSLEGWRSTD